MLTHATPQGSCIEWLGCALYVAGQSTFQETVEGGHSSGNKVSLTQILRATKLRYGEDFYFIFKAFGAFLSEQKAWVPIYGYESCNC